MYTLLKHDPAYNTHTQFHLSLLTRIIKLSSLAYALVLWFSHKYLVEIFGTAWLFRNVVDRKHTNAREARTLVPKLKMSLARNTADLRDPEFKKSLIAFSMEVRGFPLLLLLPIVSLIWYLI